MAEGEEQERTPIFTPTFLPLAAVSRHTHGRVKPAPAESRLTHAGYATSAPSHGGGRRRRRRRGRREGPRLYFHLWPPVQVPSFCPASLPSRLLAMEIWPQQVACPAISAPKCPVHNLPTLSRFGKVEKNKVGLRRSGCCSVTVGGCSPAPGESGSARERRIFPPDLSGSSSSAASFCSTDQCIALHCTGNV